MDMCTGKAEMFADKRGGWKCENKSQSEVRTDAVLWGGCKIIFYLSTERVSILELISSICHILIIWGTHVAHKDTDIDVPHTHRSKIQSWQFASSSIENNYRQSHFEVHHLFTVHTLPWSIFSLQPPVIHKTHLHLCFIVLLLFSLVNHHPTRTMYFFQLILRLSLSASLHFIVLTS